MTEKSVNFFSQIRELSSRVEIMIELILLAILIFIGVAWFRNLSSNAGIEENQEVEALRKQNTNKWSTYTSIIVVSGFFVWLLITNGNLN